MTETSFEEILTAARDLLAGTAPPPAELPEPCFSPIRARALALNPARVSESEREHAATCVRCSHLVAAIRQQMPHLPISLLLRRKLGLLSSAEADLEEYHLVEGGCEVCGARAARVESLAGWLLHGPGPGLLPHPQAAGAAAAAVEMTAKSPGGRVEAELSFTGNRATVELRSRASEAGSLLFGVWMRGAGTGEVVRFTPLSEDVDGWFTAEVELDAAELYETLGGHCAEILAGPVNSELLTPEDLEAILRGLPETGPALATWRRWAEAAAAGDPVARRVLARTGS